MIQKIIASKIIKSNRFYYGWIIIAISSLGYFFSGPGQTYFTSVFIDSYINDFGWSRSTVSSLYSISTLLSGFLLFLVGRFSDRFGQKRIIIIVAALLGATCLWNSFVNSLWMLFIGFFISRLTGQGSMTLLPSTIVPQWFIKRRAFAYSLVSIGGVIGSAILPPINTWLIKIWGWNSVWILWAGLLWFFFIPLTYIFLYNKPKELGLLPDNEMKNDIDDFKELRIKDKSWTLKEAMVTTSFWGMLFCQTILPFITTGIVFHFVSILNSKGLSSSTASIVLSLLAVVSFPTTFIAGYFLDKIKLHYAVMLIYFLQLSALVVLFNITSIYSAAAFAILQGIAMGLQSVCTGVLWPNYFGIKHLGSIRGIVMTATVIASALGPLPFGISFDTIGTYTEAILIIMILPIIGIVVAFLSPKPM